MRVVFTILLIAARTAGLVLAAATTTRAARLVLALTTATRTAGLLVLAGTTLAALGAVATGLHFARATLGAVATRAVAAAAAERHRCECGVLHGGGHLYIRA